MSYQATFNGWENLTLEDLLVAYRKGKADCFFENTFPTAIKFAEYEQDLLANLKELLASLQTNNGFAKDGDYLGEFRLLPKKLSFKPKVDVGNGHVHFSNPRRAFEHLTKNNDPIPEFRKRSFDRVCISRPKGVKIVSTYHKVDTYEGTQYAIIAAINRGARARRPLPL